MSDEIPEDLIINILSRLPIKSLMRFRCVCKGWDELIRSPSFIDANNQKGMTIGSITHHIHGAATFSVRVNEATVDLTLPVPDDKMPVDIVGSCNGLVCLVSRPWDYALWNPTTRKFRFLPKPKAKLGGRYNSQGSGFVFDPESQDYKVVVIAIRNDNGRLFAQVDVFSLSSNSWKSIQLNLPSEILRISSLRPSFVNGCSYWVAVLHGEERYRRHALLCYNIDGEKFRELIQLPCVLEEGFQTSLKVSRDSLAMFVWNCDFNHIPERTHFDMWLMNERSDGDANYSWSKHLSVGPLEMLFVPYRIWVEDGDELLVVHIPDEASGLNLFTLHPVTRQIKKFQAGCPHEGCPWPHEFCTYYESLVGV